MVSLLLSRGLSTQFHLRVFSANAEPTDKAVPFWLVLVGMVASCVVPTLPDDGRVRRAFNTLAQVLQADAQDEVLIIFKHAENPPPTEVRFAITLRDFVLSVRPPNMQQLLDLLPLTEWGMAKTAQIA